MIVVAPPGMSDKLARKLIEDDSFAHMWLVHNEDASQCVDGCDSGAAKERLAQYEAIRVHHTASHLNAYAHGFRDAHRNKGSLWRIVSTPHGNAYCSNLDDDMADDWGDEERIAYIDGYGAHMWADCCGG